MAEKKLGRYVLDKKVLAGDPTKGVPELWQAYDAGDMYYIKLWRRRPGESSEIRALWNREVRGLMRLQGYPGAGELFVRLRDLDENEKYFYAALDGGRRVLLSEVLLNRKNHNWLLNLSEVGRRRPIWEGLLRVAEALSILHSEGTLHRAISPSAVFVGPDGDGDFRLSGFEWSVRLAGLEGGSAAVAQAKNRPVAPELDGKDREYSPATDWFDFGLLVAQTLGANVGSVVKRDLARKTVRSLTNLREKEKAVILQLLEESPDERLATSEAVTQLLRNIVNDLNVTTAISGRDLVLAVRLAPELELQDTIQRTSGGTAPITDHLKQIQWIKSDLRGDVRITSRTTPYQHFVLKGEKLEYRVRQWSVGGLSTWDIGFCEAVENTPRTTGSDQHFSLGQRKLDIQLFPQAKKNFRIIRDRCAQWDKILPFRIDKYQMPPHLRDVHDFFRITQQLDTVLTVAQICPVKVVDVSRTDSSTTVEITPLDEADRTNVARHLGLQSPAEQLKDWFDLGAESVVANDEDDPKRDRYTFLNQRTLRSESLPANWFFIKARPDPSGPRYFFRAQGVWPVREGGLYLARNHGGTIAQIRRRHKAIEDMRSHESLLRTIAAPREACSRSDDKLPSENAPIPLDLSKLEALEDLWRTQPLYVIQGPPGTGKTTLIKAFVDRLFKLDRSAQVLVTAHSHHTVDDIRKKLAQLIARDGGSDEPILIRLNPDTKTEHDIEPVTAGLLKRLSSSVMTANAPAHLKERAQDAAALSDGPSDADVEVRTMRALVQDAANLTFSTLNAPDLADLTARGRRFDWSVIEEAGKAHGFDMAIALQESHRLLLFGDHHQLPPFNARLFKDLLGDPLRVKKAIQGGEKFAPGLIDASLVDDEDGRVLFAERCSLWRNMITLFGALFENSLPLEDDDFGPAKTLTHQHRMHPDIAELVGKIFYPDGHGGTILISPQEVRDRFEEDPPFRLPEGSWLPGERVVWCDVPWVQKTEFAQGEIDGLFASVPEAEQVVRILKEIQPAGNADCEIQILSPYNDQLDLIRTHLEKERFAGTMHAMFVNPFDILQGKRMGATVDQFQGSEADVVIVSLVRNNALVPWKSIGFLKERSRMNVLLSRAKQKLVIVGSWDFFASRCTEHTSPDDEYSYLGEMMKLMSSAVARRKMARVG